MRCAAPHHPPKNFPRWDCSHRGKFLFRHFFELGGDGHIALGADLDGCEALPEGFSRLGDYEKLAEYLTGCGYSDGMTQKLFCDSWMKVVKACTI